MILIALIMMLIVVIMLAIMWPTNVNVSTVGKMVCRYSQ